VLERSAKEFGEAGMSAREEGLSPTTEPPRSGRAARDCQAG
jgi:hypothetical protein